MDKNTGQVKDCATGLGGGYDRCCCWTRISAVVFSENSHAHARRLARRNSRTWLSRVNDDSGGRDGGIHCMWYVSKED